MSLNTARVIILLVYVFAFGGCQKAGFESDSGLPSELKDVPSVRLNYRYEADVPPPDAAKSGQSDERNAAVQADFDQNRPQELLDKTITSPDAKRVVAIYHLPNDVQAEFRMDMYSSEGKLLRKMTADTMAVHFPETIQWSADSNGVAFVAMLRGAQIDSADPNMNGSQSHVSPAPATNANAASAPDANSNTSPESPGENANVNDVTAAPTPTPPVGVLTFRTEQIYIADSEGGGVKAITQNEGLIYFYYVWSPDSTMLSALAATSREWQYLQYRADTNGEIFVPVGRPRLVEKTGRERRLDDALTPVQPVWSPDSSKVAVAFDVQVRIYDAGGNAPTQAAVPLRNYLLISSQAFDQEQQQKLNAANSPADANSQSNSNSASNPGQPLNTLPDEKSLVSFNPIVSLSWPADDLLYLQTPYIKRMKNEADSVTSFPRWHRLILTPQAAAANR